MFQDDLFKNSEETHLLKEGKLVLIRGFLDSNDAKSYFERFIRELNWHQDLITIHGKTMPIPRLNAWYADADHNYQYSGIKLQTNQWTNTLRRIKEKLFEQFGENFNSCLANLYRDGKDSVSWHSDDEPELGKNPTIFSISLGEERKFHIRNKNNHSDKLILNLPHNSLLIMIGSLQHIYEHQVPKEKSKLHSRVNLTFRKVY
ncbi:MAG: alpha-ketoglutarate-dependent dioxygenase AlkB [Lentisphaerales bacterium]|nr:alpha-ketoglutarate-dependent dioxygenase AlkB [Lentisphaerales bacterium]